MYPSTEDLLKIRDSKPVDARAFAAVNADPELWAEIKRLAEVKDALQALPMLKPPSEAWVKIAAALVVARRYCRDCCFGGDSSRHEFFRGSSDAPAKYHRGRSNRPRRIRLEHSSWARYAYLYIPRSRVGTTGTAAK